MSGLASVFPPPPLYYRKFTEENCNEVKKLRAEGKDVPPELEELVPPAPPGDDQKSYRNFGQIWNVEERLPSLSEFGIEQFYAVDCEKTTATLVQELKRLLHSILLGYLGLVQTLSSDPTQFPSRVEALRTLFINMHHLLNTYRPLQSKESLVTMMEDQIKKLRESAAQMRASNKEIGEKIKQLAARLPKLDEPSTPDMEPLDEWEGYNLDVDIRTASSEDAIEDDDMID